MIQLGMDHGWIIKGKSRVVQQEAHMVVHASWYKKILDAFLFNFQFHKLYYDFQIKGN